MCGIAFVFLTVSLILLGRYWFNRRSDEIEFYLDSIEMWNKMYETQFSRVDVGLLSIDGDTQANLTKERRELKLNPISEETWSEQEVRLALGYSFIGPEGQVIDKPLRNLLLTPEELKRQIYNKVVYSLNMTLNDNIKLFEQITWSQVESSVRNLKIEVNNKTIEIPKVRMVSKKVSHNRGNNEDNCVLTGGNGIS